MDIQEANTFKDVMGFNATSDVFYEDDATDTTIPDIQKVTRKNNIMPCWGNVQTMNLNTLVLENIVQSTYWRNFLIEISTYQQVCDEVFVHVRHLEPWERGTRKITGMTGMCGGVRGVGAGGVISTAYCLLYKLFTIRLTRKQLVAMINSRQSVYLRGLGFMFIRYTQPPADLWAWMEPYLDDDTEIDPRSGGGDKMQFGQLVRMLLTKVYLLFGWEVFRLLEIEVPYRYRLPFSSTFTALSSPEFRFLSKRTWRTSSANVPNSMAMKMIGTAVAEGPGREAREGRGNDTRKVASAKRRGHVARRGTTRTNGRKAGTGKTGAVAPSGENDEVETGTEVAISPNLLTRQRHRAIMRLQNARTTPNVTIICAITTA